jgi:hypothetical protein
VTVLAALLLLLWGNMLLDPYGATQCCYFADHSPSSSLSFVVVMSLVDRHKYVKYEKVAISFSFFHHQLFPSVHNRVTLKLINVLVFPHAQNTFY